jgi:glycosyltransferase involved in cell wall biosynthesis
VQVDDPHDRAAWRAAAVELLRDAEARRRLSAAALQRAARFSWEKAAQDTLRVYERTGAR